MTMPTLVDYPAHGSGRGRLYEPDAVVVTPPELPVLSLEQARAHLRQEPWPGGDPEKPDEMGHPDDSQIMDLVAAATGEIEGPNGWLGRSIMPRTLSVSLERLEPILLPLPPTLEVVSVNAEQAGGGWQFVDADQYRLEPDGLHMALLPARGVRWPSGRAVVTYRAGYEQDADGLPNAELAIIRTWVKLRLTDLYTNGGTLSKMGEAPFAAYLLTNLRVR